MAVEAATDHKSYERSYMSAGAGLWPKAGKCHKKPAIKTHKKILAGRKTECYTDKANRCSEF